MRVVGHFDFHGGSRKAVAVTTATFNSGRNTMAGILFLQIAAIITGIGYVRRKSSIHRLQRQAQDRIAFPLQDKPKPWQKQE
jgi:hypothetical protein